MITCSVNAPQNATQHNDLGTKPMLTGKPGHGKSRRISSQSTIYFTKDREMRVVSVGLDTLRFLTRWSPTGICDGEGLGLRGRGYVARVPEPASVILRDFLCLFPCLSQ